MFNDTFSAELASRAGADIEVATDNNLVEGILSTVNENMMLVIDVNEGYGDNTKVYIPLQAINFVRFP